MCTINGMTFRAPPYVYKMLFWKFMKELLCFVTKFDNIDKLVFVYWK